MHRPQAERRIPRLAALPRPVLARVEALAPGAWSAPHQHPWGQLSYAIEGVLQVETADGCFLAPPERAVWVPAGLEHSIHNIGPAQMRSLYVQAGTPGLPARCLVLDIAPLLRELVLAVCGLPERYEEDGPAGRLVAVTLDQLAVAPPAALDLPLPTDARLRKLCAALQAEPADPRTWAQWGEAVGLSERSLVRLFHSQTGLTPGAWRRRLRLLLALGPLAAGTKVAAVAAECGYASPSAFITAFSAEFGLTPTQMFATP
ncbi:helix-turn-helix transcriptional regulator [Ideonella sp. B7]|uniref:helix-turn-helix domain-containing protein n=1 Tax=Ideonella benzenivorans TaxID=2831643 RepID=UPI001CECEDEC|nr:helix-turn-helix transcriptional regulator [Ideonella benzenivorans]MCA6218537.1 helix-turn-helix transcriptional regulator [Ideonella benzenivorans]